MNFLLIYLGVVCALFGMFLINEHFNNSWVEKRTDEDIEGGTTQPESKVL